MEATQVVTGTEVHSNKPIDYGKLIYFYIDILTSNGEKEPYKEIFSIRIEKMKLNVRVWINDSPVYSYGS